MPKLSKFFQQNKKLIIVALVLIFFLCVCMSAGTVLLLLSSSDDTSSGQSNDIAYLDYQTPVDEYLGYEEFPAEVNSNEDMAYMLDSIYFQFADLHYYQEEMNRAAEEENVEDFFDNYALFNLTASIIISNMTSVHNYVEEGGAPNDGVGMLNDLFVAKVEAKERFSYWYYVPIIGSLVKAKHQSVETARAGIYDYLKNEVESVDRQAFLDEYDLDSIDDIRNAGDAKVEELARDPELRSGIDWTKVTTDLGEQAVVAVSDSYKLGTSNNPAKSVLTGGAIRYFTKAGDTVADQLPIDTQQSVLISGSLAGSIDDIAGNDFGKDWSKVDPEIQNSLTQKVIETNNSADVIAVTSSDPENPAPVELTTGDWLSVTTAYNTVPVVTTVNVDIDQTTDVYIPVEDINDYLFDTEIVNNLGFDIDLIVTNPEIDSCMDLNEEPSGIDASSCRDSYNSCQDNKYQIADGYSACISAGGGCWDIGRWEYVTEQNCPIDGDLNLDYSDDRLQPDYEYFGNGNRNYCECIVTCRQEYWSVRDCGAELSTCCQDI